MQIQLLEIWSFPQCAFIIFTICVLKLIFSITHIVSLSTLILLFLKSHTEPSSLTYSLMYTHKSRFQKAHQTHSLSRTFTKMTHDIFQGPSVPALPSLSLYAFISSRLLCSTLCWLSPRIHHSASWPWCLSLSLPVALPNTHAHKRTHSCRGLASVLSSKNPLLGISSSLSVSSSSSLSLTDYSIIFLTAYTSAFLSSHLPRHGASDLPPTWPAPGTDVLFLEHCLSFSLFLNLSAHAKKKKGVLCLYMACERVRFSRQNRLSLSHPSFVSEYKGVRGIWPHWCFSFLSHFHKTNPKSSFGAFFLFSVLMPQSVVPPHPPNCSNVYFTAYHFSTTQIEETIFIYKKNDQKRLKCL